MAGHCVGGYDQKVKSGESRIFTLRDPNNKPHVTIEMNKAGDIVQIKGNSNSRVKPEYRDYIKDYFKTDDYFK